MRIFPSMVATLTVALVMPLAANALGVSIVDVRSTGLSTSILAPGDVLTVDLVLNNDDALPVFGMGLVAAGYDKNGNGAADDGLEFVSSAGVSSVLNGSTIPTPGDPFGLTPSGGLANLYTTGVEFHGLSRDPATDEIVFNGLGVEFMRGISLTATDGDGSMDVGLGGQLISAGDIHFQMQWRATPQIVANELTLVFGIPLDQWGNAGWANAVVGPLGQSYDFDNDYLSLLNQSLTLTVIPEPGTALLLGLGLGILGLRKQDRD